MGSIGNVGDWYERADVFVLSSIVEGFPNVLLEAMAYGVPCISFDCDTGPGEIISHGQNGILVDPEEREFGLKGALDVLLSDGHERSRLGANAVSVRDRYSISKVIERWDAILTE